MKIILNKKELSFLKKRFSEVKKNGECNTDYGNNCIKCPIDFLMNGDTFGCNDYLISFMKKINDNYREINNADHGYSIDD